MNNVYDVHGAWSMVHGACCTFESYSINGCLKNNTWKLFKLIQIFLWLQIAFSNYVTISFHVPWTRMRFGWFKKKNNMKMRFKVKWMNEWISIFTLVVLEVISIGTLYIEHIWIGDVKFFAYIWNVRKWIFKISAIFVLIIEFDLRDSKNWLSAQILGIKETDMNQNLHNFSEEKFAFYQKFQFKCRWTEFQPDSPIIKKRRQIFN